MLRTSYNFLGSSEPTLPHIAPYYYGAVSEVPRFEWNLIESDKAIYEITLRDQDDAIVWKQGGLSSSSIAYPEDVPALKSNRLYCWTIQAYIDGWLKHWVTGDFWILEPNKHKALTDAESQLKHMSKVERLLSLGFLHISCKSYGQANKYFQKILASEADVRTIVMVRRVLADMYEHLHEVLIERSHRWYDNEFLLMSDRQYRILHDLLSEQTHEK